MRRKKIAIEADPRIKNKIVTWREFALTYVVLLLLVGLQMGIIIAPIFERFNPFVQVIVVMLYWVAVTSSFLYITNRQIKERYDKPMRMLSDAAKNVAEGDFSVYLQPQNTPDKYDYIDVMFTDFNAMVKELGSIETLKNDFVSNVSHEIKTPLAIIKNYTTALKNNDISQNEKAEYINTIIHATDNLSTLVTNILRLNKLENQEIEVPAEQYDLCRQLSDCILSFTSLIDKKNINLVVDIEDKAMLTEDKNMLEIVWNNLLSNAIKFTDDGGTISIMQSSEENAVNISISDTGCGISPESIKHIFDKFYQENTSHSGEGNGLGLALSHRIIEKIGGTLSVVSKPSKGSTFSVNIPIKSKLQ